MMKKPTDTRQVALVCKVCRANNMSTLNHCTCQLSTTVHVNSQTLYMSTLNHCTCQLSNTVHINSQPLYTSTLNHCTCTMICLLIVAYSIRVYVPVLLSSPHLCCVVFNLKQSGNRHVSINNMPS